MEEIIDKFNLSHLNDAERDDYQLKDKEAEPCSPDCGNLPITAEDIIAKVRFGKLTSKINCQKNTIRLMKFRFIKLNPSLADLYKAEFQFAETIDLLSCQQIVILYWKTILF